MRILIDGDVVAYRCGFAGEKTRYDSWHRSDVTEGVGEDGEASFTIADDAEPVHVAENAKMDKAWMEEQDTGKGPAPADRYIRIPRKEIEDVSHTLHSVKVVMGAIAGHFNDPTDPDTEAHVYFSCSTPNNWRTSIYPEYKANRKDRKPFWYDEVKQYMLDQYECTQGHHHEADDLISMEAYQLIMRGEPWVIASIDKDFQQIPGMHYNWVKEEIIEVDEDTALRNLSVQRIMGDSVDNIKGVPKTGAVKATAHLMNSPATDLESMVLEAYTEGYPDAAEAAWQEALNTAMVTLPRDLNHVNDMIEEVTRARKDFEATQTDNGGDNGGSQDGPNQQKDAT